MAELQEKACEGWAPEQKVSDAQLREVVKDILEATGKTMGQITLDIAGLRQEVHEHVMKAETDEGDKPVEPFVRNTATDRVHIIRTGRRTFCGWNWRSSKTVALTRGANDEGDLCVSCVRKEVASS